MSTFDFYREAKLNYTHIVPLREDGLVLFYLYEKMERGDYANDEFTEAEILSAIEHVYADVKGDLVRRNEYERNNDTIIRLQEFFLWRNEKKKLYSFKSYGIEFCKNIRDQLAKYYSPTEIKAIFDSLILALKQHEPTEDSFLNWVKIHFDIRSAELSRQIEILDQQVGDSVKTFRTRIIAENSDVHQVINDAMESLKLIKTNSDEFRNAFHGTYEIEDALLNIQQKLIVSDDTAVKIRKVREFIRRIRNNLELVSKRIDQIQPRLREFIHDFNQRDFDRKTELFLKHLLKSAIADKAAAANQDLKIIREDVPVFTILLRRNLGIARPVEFTVRKVNAEKREQSLDTIKKKRFIRQQVLYWLNNIQKEIIEKGELDFTGVFFNMLKQETDHRLTIAVKVSHKIVLKYAKDPVFIVNIEKIIMRDNKNTSVGTWKMTIKKKVVAIPS
jgi:hypothetical protein